MNDFRCDMGSNANNDPSSILNLLGNQDGFAIAQKGGDDIKLDGTLLLSWRFFLDVFFFTSSHRLFSGTKRRFAGMSYNYLTPGGTWAHDDLQALKERAFRFSDGSTEIVFLVRKTGFPAGTDNKCKECPRKFLARCMKKSEEK